MCCTVEYDGRMYAGFQKQPGKETVQGVLERAIARVTNVPTSVTGAGRTDAGAHACGQVVAFETPSALPAPVLRRALNAVLPRDIAVTSAADVDSSFHPRFDAHSRIYRYLLWNRPVRSPFYEGRAAHVKPHLDERAMHAATQLLVGRHDFTAFVASTAEGSRERTMYRAEVRREGDLLTVELEANGFMQQMVRSIVGTLVRVGLGHLRPQDMGSILASRDRSRAGDTAPAEGLYLARVRYPSHIEQQHYPAAAVAVEEEKA